ncbi:MAG: hypothetical protein NTU53_14250, partial [Planctomycetota bacterium]|nr:hypothetical protein [Planctomycetota bacterium]
LTPVKNARLRRPKAILHLLLRLLPKKWAHPQYTPIIRDILIFPHGQIRSSIIKVQHNCTSDRRHYGKLEDPPIKHEYCDVFKKLATAETSQRRLSDSSAAEIQDAICNAREQRLA